MIQGYNLTLTMPILETYTNKPYHPEVASLIKNIKKFFQQKNIIYSADLIISNNEYETIQSDFGYYKKRINYQFRLMDLSKIIVYDNKIQFHIHENKAIIIIDVKITSNFFYFFEWEDKYYL